MIKINNLSTCNKIMNSKSILKSFISGAATGALISYWQNTRTATRTRVIQELQRILWRFC